MLDGFTTLQQFLRWLHVFAGVVWIGHLYFFNFVNLQFQTSIDDPTKKLVNPPLILRALWWFRWGAMITFLSGLLLFSLIYMYTPGVGGGPNQMYHDAAGLTPRAMWILLGMALGIIMWANVWHVIWPTQRRIFGGKYTPEQLPAARKKAGLASKINTYLSAPMLFCMLAASHYPSMNPVSLIVMVIVAELLVWFCYRISTTVGRPA